MMNKVAITVLGLCLCLSQNLPAQGEQNPSAFDGLLDEVSAAFEEAGWQIPGSTEPLMARWIYHQYALDAGNWAAEAESRLAPFHASLALGLMAAHEAAASPDRAIQLYRRAEERANLIRNWTGSDATSFGYLFEILSFLPPEMAAYEFEKSQYELNRWRADEMQKSAGLLSLARISEKLDPQRFRPLLLKQALTNNHYWETTEFLAARMAEEKPQETVDQALIKCASSVDPNLLYFLKGALMTAYAGDMSTAFEKVVSLRSYTRGHLLISIGLTLIKSNRKKEAEEWISSIESLKDREDWLDKSLAEMRYQIAQYPIVYPARMVQPATVDAFISKPSDGLFQEIMLARTIVLRDSAQALTFAAVADASLQARGDFGWKETRHNARALSESVTARTYSMGGDIAGARRVAMQIKSPDVRAFTLLMIYEEQHPLPEVAKSWPLLPMMGTEPQIVMERQTGNEARNAPLLPAHKRDAD